MISIKHSKGIFTFPVTPPIEGYEGGNGIYEDVHLLKLGTVPFFDGTELKEVSWDSFFPKKATIWTEIEEVPDPLYAKQILENIRDNGEVVQLFLTEIEFEMAAQVREFKPYQKARGYIEYYIRFVEHIEIQIKTKNEQVAAGKSNPGRPPSKKV